jgi:hypothetical protein
MLPLTQTSEHLRCGCVRQLGPNDQTHPSYKPEQSAKYSNHAADPKVLVDTNHGLNEINPTKGAHQDVTSKI